MIFSAVYLRPGAYYYFAPTYAQGKKFLWDGMDYEGFPFLEHIPSSLILSKNETEMQIQLRHVNGGKSIVQVIGTDKLNSIRGTNPVGCVFSEFSYQNPRALDITEPILLENKGWAVFAFTPNGDNHALKLWNGVRDKTDWYTSILTIAETKRPDGTQVISEEEIEDLRKRGVDEEVIQAEYYCSFVGGIRGSYFSDQIKLAERDGRITKVPWEAALPVYTAWDLGVGDATAIWFYQVLGREIRFIDYFEASGEGLPYYKKILS